MAGVETSIVGEIHELASALDLVNTLECPICKEIPLPPIYICENGHNICGSCRSKISNCGLCHAKYTNTRNFTVESIVNLSKFKCKNYQDGCKVILKGEALSNHLKSCSFGPIPCFEFTKNRCNGTPIPFKDFFNHLKSHHEISGETNQVSPFPITSSAPDLTQDRNFPCFYMLYDDKIFISNIRVKNGIVYWWVSILGGDVDAEVYRARLTIYKEACKRSKLEWTFPIHSIRKIVSTIFESGLCAALPSAFMLPFLKTNDDTKKISWSTRYEIEKIK